MCNQSFPGLSSHGILCSFSSFEDFEHFSGKADLGLFKVPGRKLIQDWENTAWQLWNVTSRAGAERKWWFPGVDAASHLWLVTVSGRTGWQFRGNELRATQCFCVDHSIRITHLFSPPREKYTEKTWLTFDNISRPFCVSIQDGAEKIFSWTLKTVIFHWAHAHYSNISCFLYLVSPQNFARHSSWAFLIDLS